MGFNPGKPHCFPTFLHARENSRFPDPFPRLLVLQVPPLQRGTENAILKIPIPSPKRDRKTLSFSYREDKKQLIFTFWLSIVISLSKTLDTPPDFVYYKYRTRNFTLISLYMAYGDRDDLLKFNLWDIIICFYKRVHSQVNLGKCNFTTFTKSMNQNLKRWVGKRKWGMPWH